MAPYSCYVNIFLFLHPFTVGQTLLLFCLEMVLHLGTCERL